MDLAYNAADIVISRAGAIAITEISFLEKASILIPSPHVTDNHQFKNAQSLVNQNATIIVKDAESSRKLVRVMLDLIKNNDLRNSLTKNINKLSVSDAADKIASIALKLVK